MSEDSENIDGRIIRQLPDGGFVGTGGLSAGLKTGQKVAVFELGEEIFDPDTGESLGQLEHVKGTLLAHHVQAKLVQLRPEPDVDVADNRVLSAMMADINAGSRGPREARIAVGDLFRGVEED